MLPPTYAVLGLPRPRRLRLLSTHADSGRAFSAYRAADAPAVLVRRDDSTFGVTVLAAKGVTADELEHDSRFRDAVRLLVR